MFLHILLALGLGVFLGIFTGITPGIHVNLVATTMFAMSPLLLQHVEPLILAVFIIALSVVHSFLDTIPSIYLGAPENENCLSVLPGQKMLLKGEGYQAVKITILGTYAGLVVAILLIPLFVVLANKLYPLLQPYLGYALILLIGYMIFKEQWLWSLAVFLLSGVLGVVTFSIPNLKEPLFPMLSGLFGVSGLILSYFENTKIPEQAVASEIDLDAKTLMKALFGSSIAVLLIQFFPGLGPAQGAVLSNQLVRDIKDKGYMALVGAMGTMSVVFSLVTFYTLGKAKDGAIVVISKLMEVDPHSFLMLVFVFLVAGSIAVWLTLFFSKVFSRLIVIVNYRMLITSVIVFIFIMCLVINGFVGIIVLVAASSIGLVAPLKGVGRNHAMGCLLMPVVFNLL
ncbi:MAG: tripartite tricarboxylate transporter permease [Candidatus Woesearchaeota archaeon]